MPRAKGSQQTNGLVSAADMADMQAALAGALSKTSIQHWPGDEWSRLAITCAQKGYTLVVSPQMGGRGVRVSVPVGRGRLPIEAMTDQELLEGLRALIIQVDRLPRNE